jgi:branched-chain amino acid transport system permease protein
MNTGSAATRTVTLGAVLWVLAALLPTLLLSNYHLFQLTMVVVYAIAILGLAILTGFNGQISLGHGAFYAIGAYVTAVLMYQYNVPYWATLPVSAVVCAAVGFLIGLPALRLGGLYLALTTFALAVAVPQILKINLLEDLTGGVQGLVIDKPDPPFDLPMSADQWLYLFSLAVAGVLFLLAWNIVRGRTGRSMMAVRDHALAAEAMGIDIALLKTRSFALSAMYTGIAGSLGAIVVQFVAPDSFSIFVSIYFFVGLLVGGVSSIGGAILGGLFVEFVPNVAESISKAAPGAIYGVILIAVMFLMPSGAAGFLGALLNRFFRRGSKSGELAAANLGGSGAGTVSAAASLPGGDGSDAGSHLRLQEAERLYPATTAAGGRGEAVATGGDALSRGDGERGRL